MSTTVTKTAVMAMAALLALSGCGKKKEEGQTEQAKPAGGAQQVEPSLPTEGVPFGAEIEGKGFKVVYVNDFPAPVAGHKGRMILYQLASAGNDGGMVFVDQWGTKTEWVWHWFFEDERPKTFEKADINKDGLWDIRVYTESGHQIDLLQDSEFVLPDRGRTDRIALNGTCSEPLPEHPLWMCFDSDVRTAWESDFGGGSRPYIEVASPFGLSEGILAIRALDQKQPYRCELYADGKKVQSIELQATDDEQLVQLEPSLSTAKKIRLEIESCHGKWDSVAVAELQIR
jgi:hypothetical protein